ncbi:MAG: Uncharacterised protein [Bacteroidota bacterium]|nr:MAG: Uncharacterised protein [Bacteroidota bacterium]
MEITGKIKQIDQTKEYGSNGFQKRELVLTTEEQYPQHLLVEFVQDKCSLLDAYAVGQRIKVGINLRGREWQSPQGEIKYFNSIQGWRIDAADATSPPPPAAPFETMPDAPEKEAPDDLPF